MNSSRSWARVLTHVIVRKRVCNNVCRQGFHPGAALQDKQAIVKVGRPVLWICYTDIRILARAFSYPPPGRF